MDSTAKKPCTCKQKRNAGKNTKQIKDYLAKYDLTNDELIKFEEAFLTEIKKGLAKATHDIADIKCHITYITDLPDGTETGKFLALDLGGTNFRVLLIDLKGDRNFNMTSKIYTLAQELMTDTGEKLFNHIVDCLTDFVETHKLQGMEIPMGFTFSFPVDQLGLQKGILTKWTKGFNCSGVVGKDVVELLNQAIIKKGTVKIPTIALLNDTTGTLLSCALENPTCKIGLIVGTGYNCCYLEKTSEVENWDPSTSDATHVIINTESGGFGTNGCIDFLRTDEDKFIDINSLNPKEQILEKMVSGMYMGELVRIIILKLTKEKLLFDGHVSDILEERNGFKTLYISEIDSDPPGVYTNCKRIIKEMRLDKNATDEDLENVSLICQYISRRSAYLISAAMATILNRIGDKHVTIGVDGSVYRLHPHYKDVMAQKIKELINPGLNFNLMLSEDGSGKGAAIAAVISDRKK